METEAEPSYENYNLGIIFQLIDCREWEGVISFFNRVPEAASIGRVYGEDTNLPLHEVCQQENPPLTVINLLLDLHPPGIAQKGINGYLPLHYVCENTAVGSKIIKRLLEVYPTAARCRNDQDLLPIHLACKNFNDEKAILEILITHPEGFYLKDVHGKTPSDYSNSERIKHTLEKMAPILVETGMAAAARIRGEHEVQTKGIQEANEEYIRQLNLSQEEERNELVQVQIDFQNELAGEKERNIALAEIIIEKERSEQELNTRTNTLQTLLHRERNEYQQILEQQDQVFRSILGDSDGDQNDIPGQLTSLMDRYASQEEQLTKVSQDLQYNQEMVRNLNQLVQTKEGEIEELHQQNEELQSKQEISASHSSTLQSTSEKMQHELKEAQLEIERLSALSKEQQDQINESNRLVRVQDSRLASIKSLAQSLSFNIDSWALDDAEEEQWDNARSPILEGMESIGHSNRPQSAQRSTQFSEKQVEDYSFKTIETSSTKPSDEDTTSQRSQSVIPSPTKTRRFQITPSKIDNATYGR
jgi:hypothetical protein